MTKTPPSPQDELPIPSTQDGSGDGIKEALEPLRTDMEDEVVLMAIISPASTIGRTNPGLHFVSSFLLVTYSGDRTTAEARASTMANALCDEFWLAVLQAYVAMLVRLKKPIISYQGWFISRRRTHLMG